MSDTDTPADGQTRRLDMLLDVPLDVSVELGRCRMTIQDLLALGPGAVIELDKVAGEPLDILINDRLVARGEAVVVNDMFGVRITDVVSPQERIARLR
jgi:flagellar motor switch protein FliN/FliY